MKPIEDDYMGPTKDDYMKPTGDDYMKPIEDDYMKPIEDDYMKPIEDDYMEPIVDEYMGPTKDDYMRLTEDDYMGPIKDDYMEPIEDTYDGLLQEEPVFHMSGNEAYMHKKKYQEFEVASEPIILEPIVVDYGELEETGFVNGRITDDVIHITEPEGGEDSGMHKMEESARGYYGSYWAEPKTLSTGYKKITT